jgi:hypothetical protein
MMERAGLDRISFSPSMPFWCAVAYKKGAADIGKRAALRESATA